MSRRRRAPGEVWLETRPESPFHYVCWYDPAARRVRRESTGTSDLSEAEKIRARRVLGITEHPIQPADPAPRPAQAIPSLGEVLESYLEARKHLPSREQNEIAARHFKRICGADEPITVFASPENQQEYVDQRWGIEGRGANTVAREMNVLRAAIYESFDRHPAVERFRIGYFSQDDLPVCERWLTQEEAGKLLAHAKTRHARLYIRIALATAGRPLAILDMRWSQIDFNANLIYLNPNGRVQTSKHRPTVRLPPELKAALLAVKKEAKSSYVIEYGGFAVGTVKKAIRDTAARAGLRDVTPIVLRHTAAVWMAQASVPLKEIATYLGHKDTRMVERHYAKYHPDYQSRGANALSASMQAVEARAQDEAEELRKKAPSPQFHPTSKKRAKTAPALVLEKPGKSGLKMVGATGIEPVTPTMSR